MDKILEETPPDELIKNTPLYKKITKSMSDYFKNKTAIEYLIIEHGNNQKLIEKKLFEFNKNTSINKSFIPALLTYYTNEYLMDLWYYLNPESFELYLNTDDNYLNITSVIIGNGKVKNLLYLMERHNISFWKAIFWKNNSLHDFVKLDKETTIKIIQHDNIRNNIVKPRSDKEYFISSIKYVKDIDVLNILIDQLKDLNSFSDISYIIFKIALINNHRNVIKYFLSLNEEWSIGIIRYVINPDNLDYYNDDCNLNQDWYLEKTLEYYKKFKNTSHDKSENLKIVYDKLCEYHPKEDIINYILETHCMVLSDNLIASVVRLHCKFLLKDILAIKKLNFFTNIFTSWVLKDLIRYGKNDVLNYVISVIGKDNFKYNIGREDFISTALYNPDDRILKTVLEYYSKDYYENISYEFLSCRNISDKSKIQKLKIIYKNFGEQVKENIFENNVIDKNFKLTFWIFSKFFNNKVEDKIPFIEGVIREILLCQKYNLFEKLLNVLHEDFNYWKIFEILICYFDQVKYKDKIINRIVFKLSNIKNDLEQQRILIGSLESFIYKSRGSPESCQNFDRLLKMLKQSGLDLNMKYSNYNSPSNLLSRITNDNLFKTAIFNGLSYPDFFKQNFDSYNNYKIFDNHRRPWLELYKLVRRLETVKYFNYKKQHRNIFYDTNVCIQHRPPNNNVPVLKKGGEEYYNSQRIMFSDMNWEEDYVNPVHIEPLKLLEISKNEILVTPKIDGVTAKNIDMSNVFPPIPEHLENCVFDGEYCQKLDMYFIFGIRNKENNLNCPFDDFLELRNNHFFTKNVEKNFILNNNILSQNKKQIDKEFNNILSFYENSKGKTLWWPKAFWKIFDTDIILDILDNLQQIEDERDVASNLIKTDGYIINIPFNKKDIYKLKPSKHMTIDLYYDGTWKDKNDNVYDISFEKNIKNGVYRCYYEFGTWVARDYRPEKPQPNSREIVDIIKKYHERPWTVKEIKKYNKPAYYQNFHNNKNLKAFTKLRNLWYSRTIHDYMRVLDIGCGYLNSCLWNNKYKKIDGIDSDIAIKERFKEVDQNNKRVFVQDFTKKWDFKDDYIKNQINENFGNHIYDVILMNFTIHYAFNSRDGFDNLMREIEDRSLVKNTKLMISFIDCDELFSEKNKIEFEDGGFLKLKNELCFNSLNDITYYYPWRSKKVNTEKIFSQLFIEDKLLKYGWYKKEDCKPDYYIYTPGFSELSRSIKRITFIKKNIS